jgi:hypothetical protein
MQITEAIDRFASAQEFSALRAAQKTVPCKHSVCHKSRSASARTAVRRRLQRGHCEIIAAVEARCVRCNAPMICNPEGECWCAQFPHGPMRADAKGCFCPDCLRKELQSSKAKAPDSPASGSFK